jgi:amino acid adenylation domain-containing protein
VIGGGLPVGVLAGCGRFMDALDGGMWQFGDTSAPETGVTFFAGTFVRHPLAMAATAAVLNHLKQAGETLQNELSAKADRLVGGLNALFEEGQVPARVEKFRSICYFGFPTDQRFAGLLYYLVREKGVHIQEGFPFFLTTAHTDADLNHVIRAFRESISELQAAGFLPPARHAVIEVPLTEAQMEIRLSAQLGDEESCAYNEGFGLHLTGRLKPEALTEALVHVVNRHEALRSSLTEAGDQLAIRPRLDLTVPLVDLTQLSPDDQSRAMAELERKDAVTAFDLVSGPLVRAQLIRLETSKHVLLIMAHHLVCDGWSVNVILDEIAQVYDSIVSGTASRLSAPASFSGYALEMASSSVDKEVEGYWVGEFQEPVAPLELPVDRPRPALRSNNGATFRTSIGLESYQQIKKAGAAAGATPMATLLAGFQALLSRLTGQRDIVAGIPVAAQSSMEGTLVGHCINFLPIRVDVDPSGGMAELVRQSRRKLLDAMRHQSYTYGTLVRKLAIPRSASRLPLIEVQFNLEKVGERIRVPGVQAEVSQTPKRFVNFDLFLNLVETADELTVFCDYNTDLFNESTIAGWMRSYEALLSGFAANPEQPVGRLPLLSQTGTIAAAAHGPAESYPRDQRVDQAIDAQSSATPQSVALRQGVRTMTYAELTRQSNQLANYLRQRCGVRAGSKVGISFEPSIEMVIAVLAVMKAGGAYVPVDPGYPAERIAFVGSDAQLTMTLSEGNWPALDGEATECVFPGASTEDNAYVIYTSGSTGTPKGVEVPHRALMNFLWSMRREPGIGACDRLLAVTTLSFDIAGLELFLPLIAGAQVVIASRADTRDGLALRELIEAGRITMMQATPSTWKLLLEAGWKAAPGFRILCGGEEMPRGLANELAAFGVPAWNLYGPTETTIWSAIAPVTAGDGPVPIGRAIANTTLYVLDEQHQPVPAGLPGELYIGGEGLARGYWNRPELTAERFVENPFHGGRMYRTGDLVRSLADGTLVCMGRLDSQVKIRGHRIELGEIESVLTALPQVKDTAVVVREDEPSVKRLVAYVVPAMGTQLCPETLREAVAGRLPDYMTPALFVYVGQLPLTPNGKVDRRALTALTAPVIRVQTAYAVPETEQETKMAQIWQEVLRLERIGVHDDLLRLGADSIHLFQIASRATQAGLPLRPKQLLQHRTVRTVCQALEAAPVVEMARAPIARVKRDKFRVQ